MPEPICMVRRWAMSDPRNTRFEMSERYSSFFRKSVSNKAIEEPPQMNTENTDQAEGQIVRSVRHAAVTLPRVVVDQSFHLRLGTEIQQETNLDRGRSQVIQQLRLM